jgi:hypothetical protein
MLRNFFVQTIFAVHAIALTATILIVVKPAPAVPQLRALKPALFTILSDNSNHLSLGNPAPTPQ